MTEQEKIGQRYLEAAFSKMHELYLEENPPIEGDVVYSPKYIKAICHHRSSLKDLPGFGLQDRGHHGNYPVTE